MSDVATVERLEHELERQKQLAEASYALHTTLDLDELLSLILEVASKAVLAERGTVFLVSDDGKELWSRVLQGDENLEIRLPVGKGIAGAVGETGETINIVDAHEDERFDASWDKKTGFRTRQILCAPIKRRDGGIVGVFQLLNKSAGNFDADDESFLAALSVHAALAVENARLHISAIEKERQDREIAVAQNVQRAFQPERNTTERGTLKVAGMNELCEDASGDYYDVFDLNDGRIAVVVGDVSGHGLGSSLVMAQARAYLRAFCRTNDNVSDVLNLLNDSLSRDMTSGNFMCMFLAMMHPDSGAMTWCSAGNPEGFLVRAASGEVEELHSTGRILGIFPDAGYEPGEATALESGDTLLLYTDGATEAGSPEGELFGEERLKGTIKKHAAEGADAVLDGIRATLVEWTGKNTFNDDLTMMVVRRD